MFTKSEIRIAIAWIQDRLYEQNGYCPRACEIIILSMGGRYDSANTFHPCRVACRVGCMRYDFFENKLLEKVDCSEPAEVGFESFFDYVEGRVD